MKPARPIPAAPGEPYVQGQGSQTDAAAGVMSYLLAGPLCFGGIGYGLDRWLGTGAFVPAGVLIGMALSMYVIWLHYGADAGTMATNGSSRPGHHDDHHDAGAVRLETYPATDATNEESQ
ncbi:AtpZ/AtpI family protein [Gephyromycinifex aptenodytis]|uniref:AtpZ/AtpI family protein n=1 Tax=Gephyromycinifex aptenodytis TaxID=2716227 RepID=UPI001444A954|nr:AtpZ/AtpI family protein [Gephyromycinifex aptenodytis]